MNSPLGTEHAALLPCADRLVSVLAEIQGRLQALEDTEYAQHHDFVERCLSLSLYCRSIMNSLQLDLYAPCYALLRVALEHHLMDRLLLLGDRYKKRFRPITRTQAKEFTDRWHAGDEGTQDILDVGWRESGKQSDVGELEVTRSGVHESGNVVTGTQTLSHLYVLLYLQRYDPFAPHAPEEDLARMGFPIDEETRRRWTEQNRGMYHQTKWQSLKENLLLNNLNTEADLVKLGVHYRFLSAFVHPYPAGHDAIYGHNRPTGAPTYDHYNSELILLYLVRIAADEITDFKLMTERAPQVGFRDWPAIEEDLVAARALVSHLWFPGERPHNFDRFVEANSRAFATRTIGRPPVGSRPEDLANEDVRYYANPLTRLRGMHRTHHEMTTGLAYISPWPRPDAGP